jgi:hypothetical protein
MRGVDMMHPTTVTDLGGVPHLQRRIETSEMLQHFGANGV